LKKNRRKDLGMSEPQHPFGTDTNAGRPAPDGALSPVQPVPDTLTAAGARLAQLREAKGWSVEDVSARLKVSVQKLRALEAGDLSHLPDTTFALGVVRSYARILGADPTPFSQALRRERGVPQPDLSMPASAGADLPRGGRVSLTLGGSATPRRRSWLWGVAAVIVAVIALGMWHTNSGESSAWLARLKALANGATAQPNAASATVTEGQTAAAQGASAVQGDQTAAPADEAASDATASGTETTAPSDVAPATAGSAAQAVQSTPATAAPAAASATQPSAASAPAVATKAASAAQASSSVDATGADTSTFEIRVTQDTWVNVRQKDGKEVFSGLIHGSDAREITGIEPLKITVGNKAGIESMTIDGQPVDPSKYASSRGNVARFVLP
jgi:cytoskeleton protein RodZ